MPFLRRLAFAPVVLVAVTFVTYAVPRVLRPDRYPGENFDAEPNWAHPWTNPWDAVVSLIDPHVRTPSAQAW